MALNQNKFRLNTRRINQHIWNIWNMTFQSGASKIRWLDGVTTDLNWRWKEWIDEKKNKTKLKIKTNKVRGWPNKILKICKERTPKIIMGYAIMTPIETK